MVDPDKRRSVRDVAQDPGRLALALEAIRERLRPLASITSTRAAATPDSEAKTKGDERAEQLEHYREHFELAPIAYLVTDSAGLIEEVNAAAEELLGDPREALRGRPLLFYFDEQDREPIVELLGGPNPQKTITLETHLLPHGCEPRLPCSLRVAPIVGPDGHPRGMRWLLRDLRVETPVEELSNPNQREDQFLAILGHELRNPLASIQTGVELLSMHDGGENRDQTLRIVRAQIRQMVRIIDDLLDASLDAQRGVKLQKGPVGVAPLIERAAASVRSQVELRHQHLSLELPESDLILHADEARLAQVLTNLLDNASKYTPDGGLLGVVVEENEGTCIMRVWDEGIGIPPDDTERLGMMFVQGRRVAERAPSGLGIGLSIARMLVELHDGTLEIVSMGHGLTRGTEVVVSLPVGQPEIAPTPHEAASSVASQRRVLVIEDNVDLAELFAELLRGRGHEVQVADDGWYALELVEAFAPELVLVDIGLPGMSGYEVAARLRERMGEATMIVAVSGYPPEDAATGTFDAYVLKPITPIELANVLESLPDPTESAPG